MASRQRARLDLRQHLGGQLQQPEAVCHRRTAFADALRDFFLAEPELVAEALIGARLFKRIEVLALEVLDQSQLERFAVVGLAHDDRAPARARRVVRRGSGARRR